METMRNWTKVAFSYVTFGNCILIAFVLTQFLDGAFTFLAVQRFGIGAEGNPILVTWMVLTGHETAIVGAKVLAVFCGVVLYLAEVHIVLTGLTFLYLLAGIWPWAVHLSQI